MGILRDITERIKAEEEVIKLSELYLKIGMSINRNDSIEKFGKEVIEIIKEAFDCDFANFFICDEKNTQSCCPHWLSS